MKNEHWAVTVSRGGDDILTISSNHLSGRDLIDGDEDCIRDCARHLLAFIGAPESATKVDAVDPSGGSEGKPTTRDKTSFSSESCGTPPSADDQTIRNIVDGWQHDNACEHYGEDGGLCPDCRNRVVAELTRLRAAFEIKSVERDAYMHALELRGDQAKAAETRLAALLIDLRAILDEYNTKDGDLYRFVERIAARLSREPHQDTPQEFVNLRAEVVRLEQERDSLRSTIDQMDRVDAQYTTLLSDLQALVDQLSYQMSLTVFAREVKARLARENIS